MGEATPGITFILTPASSGHPPPPSASLYPLYVCPTSCLTQCFYFILATARYVLVGCITH